MFRKTTAVLIIVLLAIAGASIGHFGVFWKFNEDPTIPSGSFTPPSSSHHPSSLATQSSPSSSSSSPSLYALHVLRRDEAVILQRLRRLGRRRDVLSLLMASPLPGGGNPNHERLSVFERKADGSDEDLAVAAAADGGELLCTLLLLGYPECSAGGLSVELQTASSPSSSSVSSSPPLLLLSLDIRSCVRRVGFVEFDQALHPACTESPWWRNNISAATFRTASDESPFGNSGGASLWQQERRRGRRSASDNEEAHAQTKQSQKIYDDLKRQNPPHLLPAVSAQRRRQRPLPQDFVRKSQVLLKQRRRYVPVAERTYAQITAVLDDVSDAPHVKAAGAGAAVSSRHRRNKMEIPLVAISEHELLEQQKNRNTRGGGGGGGGDERAVVAEGKKLKIHGLSFAIPARLVRDSVPPLHTKIFSMNPALPTWCCNTKHDRELPARPLDAVTQTKYKSSFDQEYTAAQVLRHSFFAFSNRRGNFDCQRHTEILASGAVIYMPDLLLRREECIGSGGDRCLTGYPRDLMLEVLSLPGVQHWAYGSTPAAASGARGGAESQLVRSSPPFSSNEFFLKDSRYLNVLERPEIDFALFDPVRYLNLAERMLNFTRHHLTCAALVAYMLRTMGCEEPRSVLLLVPEFEDYQSLAVECGFAELGINYTTNGFPPAGAAPTWPLWQRRVPESDETARFRSDDWATEERIYKKQQFYGAGFVWAMRIDPPPNPRIVSEPELEERIRAGEFDLVIATNLAFKRAQRWQRSIFQQMPPLRVAAQTMPHTRIAFVETADYPVGVANWDPLMRQMIRNGSFAFSRELHEYDATIRHRRKRH